MALSTAVPKLRDGKTWRDARAEKRTTLEREWRVVCRLVDARDGGRCRVCRKRCSPTATELERRAERHHIVPLSLGGDSTSTNLVTLCWTCHQRGRHGLDPTLQITGNADIRSKHTGDLCGVRVERLTEAGWRVVGFV